MWLLVPGNKRLLHLFFWTFGRILAGCTGATDSRQTHVGNPFYRQCQTGSRLSACGTLSTTFRVTWQFRFAWYQLFMSRQQGAMQRTGTRAVPWHFRVHGLAERPGSAHHCRATSTHPNRRPKEGAAHTRRSPVWMVERARQSNSSASQAREG